MMQKNEIARICEPAAKGIASQDFHHAFADAFNSIQFNSIKLEGLVLVRHLILVHHRRPEGWLVPTDGA